MPMPPPGQAPAPPSHSLAAMLQPPVAQTTHGSMPKLAESHHEFLYRHHPRSWEVGVVDGKAVWLPEICKHVLLPGQDGIRTLPDEQAHLPHLAYQDSVQRAQRKGWVYLDHTKNVPKQFLPEGVPAGPYRRPVKGQTRLGAQTTQWFECWNVPVPSFPDEMQEFSFNRDKFNAWRLWLVTSGQLAPPNPRRLQKRVAASKEQHRKEMHKQYPNDTIRDLRINEAAKDVQMHTDAVIPKVAA